MSPQVSPLVQESFLEEEIPKSEKEIVAGQKDLI